MAALIAFALYLCGPAALAQSSGGGCGFSASTHQVFGHARNFVHGLEQAPREAVRPRNLKWELPIAAATGVLIAEGDQPAANQIQSHSLEHTARLWANVGIASEIGAGGIAWGVGCAKHDETLHDKALTALTAVGTASVLNLALKLSFNREFPYKPGSQGEFWEGGRSFPSGHAMTSFAFAAAIAHLYPHNRLVKWGAYGLAAGVALARYPGKRHYFSDILVGSALGYVTGTYVAEH